MEKILSVSVACYNLGDMIETNIKSFCECKSADKIELIITDDGSKDNTPDIVEKYVKLYPNTIKFIRQENAGPGSTVNSGIKNATGKYFKMVDGDDWVDTDNLDEYVAFLEKCDSDLVVSNYDIYDNSIGKVVNTYKCEMAENTEKDLSEVFDKISDQMHAMTFKTGIFKDNNIVLDNGFYTDTEYVVFGMQYVKSVCYFNKTVYVYRIARQGQSMNPESLRRNISQNRKIIEQLLDAYNQNEKNYASGSKSFIKGKITDVIDFHVLILLSFEKARKIKKELRTLFLTLKNQAEKFIGLSLKARE